MQPIADITLRTFVDAFLIGLATATAAAFVAGVVALFRFIRRTDSGRVEMLEKLDYRSTRVEYRQHYLIRWARAVGRRVGVPFPLPQDDVDVAEWDAGAHEWRDRRDDEEED